MFIYCICTQYLVGAPFALITASIRRGMEVISLWHCWGGMEAQVSLTVAFRSSALLGLVSLIFLLTIPHRFSMGFRSGEFAGQSSTVTPWSLNQLLVPLAVWAGAKSYLENEISISIKLVSRWEPWIALKFPGRWLRWLWISENTVDHHQQMTWQPKSSLTVETSHWTSSNMDSVPLHSSSRLWDLDFQMKCNIYFHLKRGLWTTEQQSSSFFSTAQVRWFWRCLWFRSGLVALFLKTSERGDSWCTDSSFSPLLLKLSQVVESALLDCILKLAVIPVACAPFPTQILPSSQLCI